MFCSSLSQSASYYVRSNATWHSGAESASARWPAAALVLSDEVPSVRTREKGASAAARADHAADRRVGVFRPAARAGARIVSDDRQTAARRIRTTAMVLRIAIGN